MGSGDTNVVCVDREKEMSALQNETDSFWYGRKTEKLPMGFMEHVYPEFLDVMTLGQIYRGGKMRSAAAWLDLQSTHIVAINIFVSSRTRSGTLLYMHWSDGGSGMLKFDYRFYSYH